MAGTPNWNIDSKSQITFGASARAVAPSATALDPPAKAVVMLATGDITILPLNGSVPITFTGCPVGFIPPYLVAKVTACSSSCATVD